MSVIIKGETYYRTRETCGLTGIGRSTLLRWLKSGIIRDASHRDRRGWRLFTETDIQRIQEEAGKIK
jgi:excisionase family DNA binding protein